MFLKQLSDHRELLTILCLAAIQFALFPLYFRFLKARGLARVGWAVFFVTAGALVWSRFPFIAPLFLLFILLHLTLTLPGIPSTLRFWAVAGMLFAFGFLKMRNAGMADPVIRIHFFNVFFTLPFTWVSLTPSLMNDALAAAAERFIQNRAASLERAWPGAMTLAAFGCAQAITIAVSTQASMNARPVEIRSFRLPLWVMLLLAGLTVAALAPGFAMKEQARWAVSAVLALYSLQGLGLILRPAPRGGDGAFYLTVVYLASLFAPTAMTAFVLAGIFDAAFAVRSLIPQARPLRTSTPAAQVPYAFGCAALLAALATAATVRVQGQGDYWRAIQVPSIEKSADLEKFRHRGEAETVMVDGPDENFLKPGYRYRIDRFEAPNRKGAQPASGMGPEEAEAACEVEEKRLCSATEWALACLAGKNRKVYYISGNWMDGFKRLPGKCPMRPGQQVPIGSWKSCVNEFGVADMVGNLWEWVDVGGYGEVYGLMGQGAFSGCDGCNKCEFIAMIYPSQLPILPKDDIGFRCCSDVLE